MEKRNLFGLNPLDRAIEEFRQRPIGLSMPQLDRQGQQPEYDTDSRNPAPVRQQQTQQRGAASNMLPPPDLQPLFEKAAARHGVPLEIVMALGQQESSYNPQATGQPTKWGRAMGIMQYLDSTAKGMGINPYDPEQAIDAAAKQIRQRLDKGYSMEDAVKEHFAGPNRQLWGPKTKQYGIDVLSKANQIRSLLGGGDQQSERRFSDLIDSSNPYETVGTMSTREDGPMSIPSGVDVRGLDLRPSEAEKAREAFLSAEMPETEDVPAEASSTADVLLESLKAGSVNVPYFVAYAPEAALRAIEGALEGLDNLGRSLGLPEWMLERKYIGPNDIVEPLVRGKTFGNYRAAGISDIAKMIKGAGDKIENEQHAKVLAGIAKNADDAFAHAIDTGDFGPVVDVLSDPKAWAAAFGQAAPSLAVALIGGLPAIAALEGGAALSEVKEFEEKNGKIGDLNAANAILQTATVNTLLEKLGLDAMLGRLPKQVQQRIVGATIEGAKGRLVRGVTGAAIGGGAEMVTEGLQTVNENLAKRMHYDESQGLSEGVLLGAMGGGVTGGAVGGVSGAMRDAETPAGQPTAEPQIDTRGPLTRALNAGEQAAAEARVTVTSPTGQISGFLESYQADGQGGFVARILGDDGLVYSFTHLDGVNIQRQPTGPLALPSPVITVTPDGAAMTAEDRQSVIAAEQAAREEAAQFARDYSYTDDIRRVSAIHAARESLPDTIADGEKAEVMTTTGEIVEGVVQGYQKTQDGPTLVLTTDDGTVINFDADDVLGLSLVDDAPAVTDTEPEPSAQNEEQPQADSTSPEPKTEDSAKPIGEMTLTELSDRRQYLSEQARLNGGWNKRLLQERDRIEAATEKLLNQGGPRQDDIQARPSDVTTQGGHELVEVFYPRDGINILVRKDHLESGRDKLPAFQKTGARWYGAKSTVKRSALQSPQGESVGAAQQATEGVRTRGHVLVPPQEIPETALANQVADDSTVQEPDEIPDYAFADEAPAAEQASAQQPETAQEPIAEQKVEQPQDKTKLSSREKALQRIKAGRAWFGTEAKANDFITKNDLGDSHTIEQTGAKRFEVVAKQRNESDGDIELYIQPSRYFGDDKVFYRVSAFRLKDGGGLHPEPIIPETRVDSREEAIELAKNKGIEFSVKEFLPAVLDTRELGKTRIRNATLKPENVRLTQDEDGVIISTYRDPETGREHRFSYNSVEEVSDALDGAIFDWAANKEKILSGLNPDLYNFDGMSWSDLTSIGRKRGVYKVGMSKSQLVEALKGESAADSGKKKAPERKKTAPELLRDEIEKRTGMRPTSVTRSQGVTTLVLDPSAATRQPEPEEKGYEQRKTDRINRIEQAQTEEDVNSIVQEEHSDPERYMEGGTSDVQAAASNRRQALRSKKHLDKSKARYESGEWVPVDSRDTFTQLKYAEDDANRRQREDNKHEYRAVEFVMDERSAFDSTRYIVERRLKPTTDSSSDALPSDLNSLFAKNKIFTSDAVEKARARLRKKLGQLNSGIDPEMLIDGMTIAGAYIEAGTRKFSDYAQRMINDLGDGVKPYLLSFWEGARNYPNLDTKGMTSVEDSAKEFQALLAPQEVKSDAVGEVTPKPKRRTRKTGKGGDMTLTQDWGVDYIDGYSDSPSREIGNSTKDAFLNEARKYLNEVAKVLTERGYSPRTGRNGKPERPVSVNESGMAVSGDVSLNMLSDDGERGIYASIGGTTIRGTVPTTPSGISILYRTTNGNQSGGNNWAPVDLSAIDLANIIDNQFKREKAHAERQANARNTAPSATGQSAEAVPTDAQQGATGDLFGQSDQGGDGVNQPSDRQDTGRDTEAAGQREAQPTGGNATREYANQGSGRSGDSRGAGTDTSGAAGRAKRGPEPVRADGRLAERKQKPVSSPTNYRIAEGEIAREGSWKATAERNVEIVELIKRLKSENRMATPEEKAKLVKFTGWGASEIANGVFPDRYGRFKDGWDGLGTRLKEALTEDEYANARRSTQYAHYTSESVIRSIYNGLSRLGFKGGQVLEPGMGTGLFNGLMPDAMANNTTYTGVEFDQITGEIAKQLYPASNVIIGDYSKTSLPKGYFDAAIGNPPFASITVTNDPEYRRHRFMLHDYFFAKTIDRVRDGGLLVFVTSKGTMDKRNDKARRYLSERANLLGAIRLPQTAFKDNAGTEVVTDVLFLQKRGDGVEDNGVSWGGLKEVKTKGGEVTLVNEYFADHPEMVLGDHALTGSMYRANEYTVVPKEGQDIEQLFSQAIQNLPESVYNPNRNSPSERAAVIDRDFNPSNKKEGGLYVSDDGVLMQVESGAGVEAKQRIGSNGKPISLKPREIEWLKGYVGVRDALKQAQFDQLNDGDWQSSLKALNKAYDAFTKKHGPILAHTVTERENADGTITETKRFKNKPLWEMDAEGALVYALETINNDGSISKAPVLLGRVLSRPAEPEIKTTQDALFVSLNQTGRLDIDDVARLAKQTREEVIEALGDSVYESPDGQWQTADQYLSGNVVRKLEEARAAADLNPRFKRNVEALLAVQPAPLGPNDIVVRLGTNWVPESDIKAFAQEVLGENMEVSYKPQIGHWEVNGNKYNRTSEWAGGDLAPSEILSSVLNSRQLKVTYRDHEGKTHTDPVKTEAANAVAAKMRAEFQRWVWRDKERSDRLVNYYNETFNNIVPRQYDGSHLTLPGVSLRFKLHPHQKRAVWRSIQDGDTYLAHAVGAGKTFTMIASGMEQRRLGLIQKPMYVVPNHMLAQFSREFLELYPTANIMVADEQNFHTSNRRRFMAQAALNDPDAVIITHSAFSRLGMGEEYASRFIQKQITEWREALEEVDNSDRITKKQIENRIEQLERRLEGKQTAKDQVLNFEEMGIDYLFVDEFHEFRKLDFATNQSNIKGIDPQGSQRALDLYMKVQYLREKKPNRSLTAASGTPITNTMGELFTVQRFFQLRQLEEDGLASFDAWSAQYGDTVTALEQNAAGGYEAVTRFAKFQNVPELMRRVRTFMDILTSNNLGALVQRPEVIGGGREIVVTPQPDGYREYQKQLEERIKAIRNRKGPPQKGDDIILNVISDGRFSAIDMRFVDPNAKPDPNSKLNKMLDDVIEHYYQTADNVYTTNGVEDPIKGSSIIVFTDIGLGEQAAEKRGFNMREWIEKRLTDAGIPAQHIAFMRDYKQHAKKERLFADMREGKKRILIGSKDMETGTNVQKRLTFLAHLDAPWFPASIEQREGRIIRQGNQNPEVTIKAYATKGSYDSTMWGMNSRKARFIEQAMNGDFSVRNLEDVSEASSFEMASALASGDERYLKLAGLRGDVERLNRLKLAHYDDQNKLRREKGWAESRIERLNSLVAELDAAISKRKPIKAGEFVAKVGNATFDSRDEFSVVLFDEFKKRISKQEKGPQVIGQIGGFDILFDAHGESQLYVADVTLDLPSSEAILVYPLDPDLAVKGLATKAANQVNGLDRKRQEFAAEIETLSGKIRQIESRQGVPFAEEADLIEKQAELNALESELAAEAEAESQAEQDSANATSETDAANNPDTEVSPPSPDVSYSAGTTTEQVLTNQKPIVVRSNAADRALDNSALRDKVFDGLRSARGFHNDAIGTIKLSRKGWSKSRANAADRAKLLATPHLDRIIRNGVYLGNKPAKGKGGIESYHYVGHRAVIDGVPLIVVVTMEQNANGDVSYYNHATHDDVFSNGGTREQVDSLLAAYRRPLYSAQGNLSRGDTLPIKHSRVESALRSGPLGGIVDKLIGEGHLTLHPHDDTLPTTVVARGPVIQGYTDPSGHIHLVTENLTPQTAMPVLLHEVFHAHGEKLIGTKKWNNLLRQLDGFYAGALRRQSEGRVKENDFWDGALKRVQDAKAKGLIENGREAEEFGAYAIENYELAPNGIKKWIDNIIGAIKDFLARRFNIQLGDITPAQLRAFAVAALREKQSTFPAPDNTLGGSALGSGLFSANSDQNFTSKDKTESLNAALKFLDEYESPIRGDYVGNAIRDMDGAMGLYQRFAVHPYTIASMYPEFTPVFNTAVAQSQSRNQIIEELHEHYRDYQDLPQASKDKVNKVMELGRLMSQVYTVEQLQDGVTNTGSLSAVEITENGPQRVNKPIKAGLTEVGEVVSLNEDEIRAYQSMRKMYDSALDMFRDQFLRDMGLEQYIGVADASKALMEAASKYPKAAPERSRLENMAGFVADIEQSKRTGYVPFTRYGDYVVAVKERLHDIRYREADDGYFYATNVPEDLYADLDNMGAYYDHDEGAWRLTEDQRDDLEGLNEQTIYSEKVETGVRDMWGRNSEKNVKKNQRPVDQIPSVKKAIDRILKDEVGGNPNRRIVAFPTTKKRNEQGIDLSSLDALAEVAMLDQATWDSVREELAKALQAGGFRRHFFQSTNVPGYSLDFERSSADYIVGISGYLARRQHSADWDKHIGAIKGEKLHQYATKFRAYSNEPSEEYALLRQTGFFMYIAGNISSAVLNATQVPMMTMPFFNQITSSPQAVREMAKAYKDALSMLDHKAGLDMFDFNKAPADISEALKRAKDEGLLLPLQSLEVMGVANRRSVEGRRYQKAYDRTVQAVAFPFTATERLNRIVTFIAAHRLAQKTGTNKKIRDVFKNNPMAKAMLGRGEADPYGFAEFAVAETQFTMGKINRPAMMRNVGAPILQFKSFMLQFLETVFMRWPALQGKKGKKARNLALLTMMLMAGVWGFPGAEDLRELVEKFYKGVTKKDFDTRDWLRRTVYDVTDSMWLTRLVDSGGFAAGVQVGDNHYGIDMSQRVGMGRIMPETQETIGVSWLDTALAFGGIPVDMGIGRPVRFATQLGREDVGGAVTQLMPNFVENARRSHEWATKGVLTRSQNKMLNPEDVDTFSVVAKSIGFQPVQISELYAAQSAQRRAQSAVSELRRHLQSKLARAMAAAAKADDPERREQLEQEVQDVFGEIVTHNQSVTNPEDMIEVTNSNLNRLLERELFGSTSRYGREGKAAASAAIRREAYGQDRYMP